MYDLLEIFFFNMEQTMSGKKNKIIIKIDMNKKSNIT